MTTARSFLAVNISIAFLFLFLVTTTPPLTMSEAMEKVNCDEAVNRGNANFTRWLYDAFSDIHDGNIFFSPISIHAILALAAQGSAGDTREALCKVLHVPDIDIAAEGYKVIMSRLNAVKGATLLMANKIYLQQGCQLQDGFRSIVSSHFLAEVEQVNFAQSQATAQAINGWVEKKTNSKIRELISAGDLDALTRLVLVNAIYFKGAWLEPFDPANTVTEKFHKCNGETVDVQMMHLTKTFNFKYDSYLNAKVLEMPYTNRELSMIFILPEEGNHIMELEERLIEMEVSKVMENLHRTEVVVALPKFKIEHTIDLNGPLSELGLEVMFDKSRADFSSMLKGQEQLYVSKVIQKTFIEVNEEGAEAAAATGHLIRRKYSSWTTKEPEEFKGDHPFLLILSQKIYNRDEAKKILIVFNGCIKNPLES